MVRGLMVLAILAFPVAAAAGISSPDSSLIFSRDGTRMLVMRSPYPQYDHAPPAMLADGRVVNIAATFAKSGVYDSLTLRPLWQVDWYVREGCLLWSDDLRHVARFDLTGYLRNSALHFYEDGKLIRSYKCTDLLTGLRQRVFLPYSTGDWHDRWYDEFDLTGARTAVSLTTARRRLYLCGWRIDLGLRESYQFDLDTGNIYKREVSGRWVVWAYGTAALLLPLAMGLLARTLWRPVRRRISLAQRGFEVVTPVAHAEVSG
jgi:hypothetical protein